MSTSIEYKGHIIKIETDDCPPNPRTEFDSCCKMVCFHKNHKLGDETDYNRSDYNSWDELKKDIVKQENAVIILPLYLYDHSGITISTTPFSCRWDSGQVGFVYMTRESIKNDFGIKRLTKKALTKIQEIIKSEVKVYDDYLTGNVYSYQIYLKDNDNVIDLGACSGYFGYEPDESKWDVLLDAKAIVDSIVANNPQPAKFAIAIP
jgi:hypothetical protein